MTAVRQGAGEWRAAALLFVIAVAAALWVHDAVLATEAALDEREQLLASPPSSPPLPAPTPPDRNCWR